MVWEALQLKTTTRPNRHVAELRAARSLLSAPADGRPLEIADVGPGLAVKYLGRLADQRVPVWNLVKRIESAIRRIPMPDGCYENYEAHELVRALDGLRFNLTVIDVNPKVVRVIAKEMANRNVSPVVADLGIEDPPSLAPLRGKFDLVVAMTVIGRVKSRLEYTANLNIAGLVRLGGVLLASGDFTDTECAPIEGAARLYRRRLD
jgi:hypothetical protein